MSFKKTDKNGIRMSWQGFWKLFYLVPYDIVIHKKYIIDHLDFQNIFLMYVWSSSLASGSQLPNLWYFLSVESANSVFCYVNEVTFGKHWRMGASGQCSQPRIRALELPPPTSRAGTGAGD